MITPLAFLSGWIRAGTAAGCIITAGFLVAFPQSRPARRSIALFLFLVGLNQAMESLRSFAIGPSGLEATFAAVGASLDPVAFWALATAWFAPRGFPGRRWLPFVATAGIVLAVGEVGVGFIILFGAGLSAGALAIPLTVFTVVVYTAALLGSLPRRGPAEGAAERLLFYAFSLAVVPSFASLLMLISPNGGITAYPIGRFLLLLLPAFGAAFVYGSGRRAAQVDRAHLGRGLVTGFALAWVINSGSIYVLVGPIFGIPLGPGTPANPTYDFLVFFVGACGAAIRWFAFTVLVTVAALRFDVFGMPLGMRRRAAKTLVALWIFVATSLALFVVEYAATGNEAFDLPEATALLAVLIGAIALANPLGDTASPLLGAPRREDGPGRRAFVEAVLRQATVENRLDELEALLLQPGWTDGDRVAFAATITAARDDDPLRVGGTLARRYQIRSVLARGGATITYRAWDDWVHRDVVAKEVFHGATDAPLALREAQMVGTVQHPAVVTLFDVVRRGSSTVLVFEHIPGGSLGARVAREGRLPGEEAARLADDVLAALEALHAKGVVHRDVKPSNILLTADGRAKLSDFGLARLDRDATRVEFSLPQAAGTPGYIAPEILRGEVATPQSDLWSLGQVLRNVTQRPLEAPVEAVIDKATSNEMGKRWTTATVMRAALAHACHRTIPDPAGAPTVSAPSRPRAPGSI
ncbi:MAG: serine/threonine-protein kinase [Thermoplasmatota archaeon]